MSMSQPDKHGDKDYTHAKMNDEDEISLIQKTSGKYSH